VTWAFIYFAVEPDRLRDAAKLRHFFADRSMRGFLRI